MRADNDRAHLLQYLLELERQDPFCNRLSILLDDSAVTGSIACQPSGGLRSQVLDDGDIDNDKLHHRLGEPQTGDNAAELRNNHIRQPGIMPFLVERARSIRHDYETGVKSLNEPIRQSAVKSCDIILETLRSATKRAITKAQDYND